MPHLQYNTGQGAEINDVLSKRMRERESRVMLTTEGLMEGRTVL